MSEPAHLAATCPTCEATGYEARNPCPLHDAAPDLLAALEEIKAMREKYCCEDDSPAIYLLEATVDIAEAAITKAKLLT